MGVLVGRMVTPGCGTSVAGTAVGSAADVGSTAAVVAVGLGVAVADEPHATAIMKNKAPSMGNNIVGLNQWPLSITAPPSNCGRKLSNPNNRRFLDLPLTHYGLPHTRTMLSFPLITGIA
jgi:hypothetical protein